MKESISKFLRKKEDQGDHMKIPADSNVLLMNRVRDSIRDSKGSETEFGTTLGVPRRASEN